MTLLTFTVCDRLLAVDVSRIRGLASLEQVSPLPTAPPEIAGLVRIRGRVLTAIDVAARLGLPAGSRAARRIELQTDTGPVALLVDEVGEVVTIDPETLEPPPDSLREQLREVVVGVCRVGGDLVAVADAEKLAAVGVAGGRS